MKHYNIPVFISHFGCPNACVFCNQKKINGRETDVSLDDLKFNLDLSFLEKLEIDNIDEIVEKLEKFYEANYIEPVESNLRKKIVEKFKKIIKFTKNIFIDYSDVFLNYTSINLNKKIERAPPYNFDLYLEQK